MKVSYCITCHNRLWQLEKTLDINLDHLLNDEQLVLVDYNSPDLLYEYIFYNEKFYQYLKNNQLKYIKVKNVKEYNCPMAKNLSHKLADGEIVVNLDADNILLGMREKIDKTNKNYSSYILHMAVMIKNKTHPNFLGSYGRLAFKKIDFLNIGGYDESLLPMAYQDTDIINRAIKFGYHYVYEPVFTTPIKNDKNISFVINNKFHSWLDCKKINQTISDNNIKANKLIANLSKTINLDYEIIQC